MKLNTIDTLKKFIELENSAKKESDKAKIKEIKGKSRQELIKLFVSEFGINKEDSQFKNANFLQKFALSVIGVILDFICYAIIAIFFVVCVSIYALFGGPRDIFAENENSNFLVNLLRCLIQIPMVIIFMAIGAILSIVVKTFVTIGSAISSVKNISFFGDGGSGIEQSYESQNLEEPKEDPDLFLTSPNNK